MGLLFEQKGIQIAINCGGTFTDVHAVVPGRRGNIVLKLLSPPHRGEPIDLSPVSSIHMGTTVATNALLERKGECSALLITKGFKDLLVIGNQACPEIFDVTVTKPGVLYETVVEVDERVTLEGFPEDPEKRVIGVNSDSENPATGLSKEVVRILKNPNLSAIREQSQALYDDDFRSLSGRLAHSYTFLNHEVAVPVSISSGLAYLTPLIHNYLQEFR
ncbi:hypothetical protein GQ53DRAFT_779642 [Thozetella sp. PMI_491]|nr:hypothetical protein GQ53DRAFT_779642 [Thozetella sp. PMI_491]